MECTSKASKECAGVGHPLWKGMCSNCADKASERKTVNNSLSGNDWRENMPELTNDPEMYSNQEEKE